MFNVFLKSFITCCLIVGLLPSFSCLCTTKAFAQTSTSISEIFGELPGTDGFSAENDNDQLLGANDCLPNDNNQLQSEDEGNQSQDVVLDELSQQSFALGSMPVNASDANNASSNENRDPKPQDSEENTTPVERNNSVENSENGFNYVDYKIKVTTQDIRYAGFDGLVQIRVNGEYGSTGFHTLDKSGHNDFERGNSDDYSFRDRSVGVVNSVTLNTDSENNWFLRDINVVVEGQEYFFWANSSWINGTIDIPVSKKRKYFIECRTADYTNAGSHDDFYVCFIGENGYTGYYNLGDPARGETRSKEIVSKDVGNLKYAVVSSDQDISLNNTALDSTIDSVIDMGIQVIMAVVVYVASKVITKHELKNKSKMIKKEERIEDVVKKKLPQKNNKNTLINNNNNHVIEQNKTIINVEQSNRFSIACENHVNDIDEPLNIDNITNGMKESENNIISTNSNQGGMKESENIISTNSNQGGNFDSSNDLISMGSTESLNSLEDELSKSSNDIKKIQKKIKNLSPEGEKIRNNIDENRKLRGEARKTLDRLGPELDKYNNIVDQLESTKSKLNILEGSLLEYDSDVQELRNKATTLIKQIDDVDNKFNLKINMPNGNDFKIDSMLEQINTSAKNISNVKGEVVDLKKTFDVSRNNVEQFTKSMAADFDSLKNNIGSDLSSNKLIKYMEECSNELDKYSNSLNNIKYKFDNIDGFKNEFELLNYKMKQYELDYKKDFSFLKFNNFDPNLGKSYFDIYTNLKKEYYNFNMLYEQFVQFHHDISKADSNLTDLSKCLKDLKKMESNRNIFFEHKTNKINESKLKYNNLTTELEKYDKNRLQDLLEEYKRAYAEYEFYDNKVQDLKCELKKSYAKCENTEEINALNLELSKQRSKFNKLRLMSNEQFEQLALDDICLDGLTVGDVRYNLDKLKSEINNPNVSWNPNDKQALSLYCFNKEDRAALVRLKTEINNDCFLNLPTNAFSHDIKKMNFKFNDMSKYIQERLKNLSNTQAILTKTNEVWKAAQYEINMLQSYDFHLIASKYVWKANPNLSVENVVKISKIIYDNCVITINSLNFFQAGCTAGWIVDLGSFISDITNTFLIENISFKDIINKDANDSEEIRFLKGICVLEQGLNRENSSQELSNKYLSYIKDFNIMFRDFCSNTENLKQISTQTLSCLIELISDLNTFEFEYSKNGFKSNELADLDNMLFYVYYCRAGLDNFDSSVLKENNADIDNESKFAVNNSSDENNYLCITKQPSKLTYDMLEPLNIEDVVLTLKTAGNDPVEISYYDLNNYGISVNHYSGWALSLDDKTLDFNYSKDNINLSASLPITVEPPAEMKNLIYQQNSFESINFILQWLQNLYSNQYGNESMLAEDIIRSTQSILNAKNCAESSKWLSIVINVYDFVTFIGGFVCPPFALIAAPAKFIVSAGIALATYTDCWYVDYIKTSSPEYSDRTFCCRDWVYAENPQIVPADNVPYDVEIKTSNDFDFGAGYGGNVRIQFISENFGSDNEKTQDGSRLLSKTHELIGEDFDSGSLNKYYVADKNIGDISKIKLFTKSDNEWKLESLNLVVNGKKYKCKWNNWVNGNIELVPEKDASEAVYDIKIKTFNSADAVNAKDIKNALQIQFNGENNNLYSSTESVSFKKSNKIEDCFEVQDIFTNNVTKLQSVVITNTKDCKLPIDYLIINNQKYYVRQVISKGQSVVIDPSDKKSAYDIKFKISDIKNFDCKGKLKDNLFVKISGKDPNYKDVEINNELPLTLSDKDINSLTSGSEAKFYLVSSVNIKDVEKVEIIRKNDTNAPFLPLDYVEVVSNCIDKWGDAVEMPERRFNCGKYFRDSIVLSASDKVYKFDFKNLQDNQLQSLTAYSMSLGGKIDAGNTAANSDTVNTEPFFPALDYNSDKSQEIIIGDSCKIDKLLCLDFASESSEPNKKWGLDYVTYNGIKANVNSSFSNEESKFRIDFTNRYSVTFHTKDRNIKSHLNFSIIGENKNETKTQDLANFKGDVAAFEDENNIDKIYGIKLNSDSEFFLDSVEVNAPCGSHTFICRRSFKGNLTLSVEDQVLDIEIKTGDVRWAASSTDVFIQLVKKADKGSNEKDVFSKKLEFEESVDDDRKQIHSKVFVLLESKKETVKDFNMIKIKKGCYKTNDWFMDSIVINGTTYYYRNWIKPGQEITINASSPKTAYNVDVKTSDFYEAGTNCDVSIILENSNGDKSDDISLELQGVDEREQGEENHYFIASDFGSKVDKCIVKVSDPGAWAFDYIKITQLDDVGKEKDSHTFYFGRWAHRSETVLSKEDKIYTISAKEMDSFMLNASENHSGDAYDITLIDNENKDKPKKSEEFRILRQCSEHKYASLVHDPKEEPIQNVSCVDVRFMPDESFMSILGKHNMGLRPVDVGQNDAHLDYIKVNDKTFFCRKTLQANKERTFDWNITKTFGLGCEDLSRTTLYPGYHPYDVCVYTGDRDSAGTNDDVYIKLYGSNSKSESVSTEFMRLDTPDFDDFEQGDFTQYSLLDKTELNTITKVEVKKKGGGNNDWGLDYLTVKLFNGIIYTFDYFDWVRDDNVFIYPNGSINVKPYNVTVTTANNFGAGTDSDIYIKIIGVDAQNNTIKTARHLLDKPNYNDFEKGDVDTYSFMDTADIVDIKAINLENAVSDCCKVGGEWQVGNVNVDYNNHCYAFDCNNTKLGTGKNNNFDLTKKDDNVKSYAVRVKTADKLWAGTNSDIYITVYGKDGYQTKEHELSKPYYDDFERNDFDTYYFLDSTDIKDVEKITLRNGSVGDGEDWCVDYVKLIHSGCNYEFFCNNCWIEGNKTADFRPSNMGRSDNNMESFRIVTKIKSDKNCDSLSDIMVKITGEKDSTEYKQSTNWRSKRGRCYAFSFNDKNVGDTVKRVEFYKIGGFGSDMIGIDTIYVYYKNRWYKAYFNVNCDLNNQSIPADAEVIGVVPSH